MHIAVVAYQYGPTPGGLSKYSCELVKYLRKRGHEVTVFCNKDQDGDVKIFDDFLKTKATKKNLWRIMNWQLKNCKNFDVVHATEIPASYCGWMLAFLSGAKFVLTIHGNDYLQTRSNSVLKLLSNFVMSRAKTIAVSNSTARLLHFTPSSVINPGLDFDWLNQKFTKISKPNKKVVLSVCRLTKLKGVDNIIRAFSELPQDYVLYVIGDGPDRERLESITHQDEDIHFEGYADPRPFYDIADVLVVPSRFALQEGKTEAFGKVYVEASAFGVPSIAINCGGIPDAVVHEKTGLLINPEDFTTEKLADSIRHLCEMNSFDRMRMSENCKKWVKNFDWNKQIKEVEKCYQ